MTVISIHIICDQFSARTISPELAAQWRRLAIFERLGTRIQKLKQSKQATSLQVLRRESRIFHHYLCKLNKFYTERTVLEGYSKNAGRKRPRRLVQKYSCSYKMVVFTVDCVHFAGTFWRLEYHVYVFKF